MAADSRSPYHFSLRFAFGVATVAGVMFAISRHVPFPVVFFGSLGLALCVVAVWVGVTLVLNVWK